MAETTRGVVEASEGVGLNEWTANRLSADPNYTYCRLPRGKYVRYFVLNSGGGDEPLTAQLHVARLSKLRRVEAISYVWGSQENLATMTCNDKKLHITRNLEHALRTVRLPHKKRRLWADAVCIDQGNLQERGHQVKLMGDVYSLAKRVLICMGPDKHKDGEHVASLLRDVNHMIQAVLDSGITVQFDSFPWPEPGNILLGDWRWLSFDHICQSEWFKRGWVVQEAALARIAQVLWGSSQFDWDHLVQAASWKMMRVQPILGEDRRLGFAWSHLTPFSTRNVMLSRLLGITIGHLLTWPLMLLVNHRLSLSDERDHIYAFISYCHKFAPDYHFDSEPDYTCSPTESYLRFAKDYITTTADLSLLDFVNTAPSISDSFLPSWVPRWNENLTREVPHMHQKLTSRHDSVWRPKVRQDNSLMVRGILVDEIEIISDCLRRPKQLQPHVLAAGLARFWNTISGLENIDFAYGNESLHLAFLNCLLMGFQPSGPASGWASSRSSFMQSLREQGAEFGDRDIGSSPSDDNLEATMTQLQAACTGRELGLTKRGYFALVPETARPGDLCCILFGSTSPYILRRTGPRESTHQCVGPAYVSGKVSSYSSRCDNYRYFYSFGTEESKDWVDWEVKEQDILIY